MRLKDISYITTKKDHLLKSNFIFYNQKLIEEIKKLSNKTKNLKSRIEKLLSKHRTPLNYSDYIENIIKNNGALDTDFSFDKEGMIFQLPDTKSPPKHAYLKIGPKTKKKDFLDAYEILKPFFDKDDERNKSVPHMKRNLRILELAMQSYTWEDIQEKIRWEFDQKVSEHQIRVTVNRLCDKIGIKEKSRPVIKSRKNNT